MVPLGATARDGSTIHAIPNCVPELDGQKIFIRARRNIDAGEELSIDYALVGDEKMPKALRVRYVCHCGARRCRGTMIAGRWSR